MSPMCHCMMEDPGDGAGERVMVHSLACPMSPDYEEPRKPINEVTAGEWARAWEAAR